MDTTRLRGQLPAQGTPAEKIGAAIHRIPWSFHPGAAAPVPPGAASAKGRPGAFLYIVRDEWDVVLYVGVTFAVPVRLSQHAAARDWWPENASVSSHRFPSRGVAEAQEAMAIYCLNPRHNVLRPYPWLRAPHCANFAPQPFRPDCCTCGLRRSVCEHWLPARRADIERWRLPTRSPSAVEYRERAARIAAAEDRVAAEFRRLAVVQALRRASWRRVALGTVEDVS